VGAAIANDLRGIADNVLRDLSVRATAAARRHRAPDRDRDRDRVASAAA